MASHFEGMLLRLSLGEGTGAGARDDVHPQIVISNIRPILLYLTSKVNTRGVTFRTLSRLDR